MRVILTVNRQLVELDAPAEWTLLRLLRDRLHLTGAKDGCSQGHCGACTVILNGKATRSCLVRVDKLHGAEVETIEGLATDGQLHPLQEAFMVHGAIQCGFCTSGMILTAKALLAQNPCPSRAQILAALTRNHNLCRCTGYESIVRAIQDAAPFAASGSSYTCRPTQGAMGLVRRDAVGLVTGSTRFADDIVIPGMLYGCICWADRPHAQILGIGTARARAMPGVAAVLTAADIPGQNVCGLIRADQPAIADRVVRAISDGVACVFAETPEQARRACEEIAIDYRTLPGVFDPSSAASQGAPHLHEDGNLIHYACLRRGDAGKALDTSAAVAEYEFTTPMVEHAYLEPESGLARVEADGTVTLWIGTQAAFEDRRQLAPILGMPPEKIRIVQLPMGGAFGAKEELLLHQYLALGALKTGKTVKITLRRDESLRSHPKRHAARIRMTAGADRDGRLLALRASIVLDGGAYTSMSINALETGLANLGPYFVPNLDVTAEVWYTNNIPAGAMRGFGVNQVAFAVESCMDELACQLGIDPFELRLRSALDVGLPTVADHVIDPEQLTIKDTIRAARSELARTAVPSPTGAKRIGVGMACGVKTVGVGRGYPESSGAAIEIDSTGSCRVFASHHEMGQGAHTGLVALVSTELGILPERIEIVTPDTSCTPPAGTTTASRQTFITGNAVLQAARELKHELSLRMAEALCDEPGPVRLEGDLAVDTATGRRVRLAMLGERFRAESRYRAPDTLGLPDGPSKYGTPEFQSRPTHWCYAFGTQVAIVEVDVESGAVRVLKMIAAHDVGKAIDRLVVQGQIEGGVVMGMGYALSEEFVVRDGVNQTTNLRQCGVPAPADAPEIVSVILERAHPLGPFGAKGLAEMPTIPTAPAILNAIRDAAGVRITTLPATPARLRAALSSPTSASKPE